MEEYIKNLAGEMVIALLDILVILQVEDNPLIGIILVVLFDTVTKDQLIRITLTLLVMFLGLSRNNSSKYFRAANCRFIELLNLY